MVKQFRNSSFGRPFAASGLGLRSSGNFPSETNIADFAAPSLKLAVEIDGGYHVNRAAADARKDRHLGRAGYRVLRIPAELVMRDIAAAVELVRAVLVAQHGI